MAASKEPCKPWIMNPNRNGSSKLYNKTPPLKSQNLFGKMLTTFTFSDMSELRNKLSQVQNQEQRPESAGASNHSESQLPSQTRKQTEPGPGQAPRTTYNPDDRFSQDCENQNLCDLENLTERERPKSTQKQAAQSRNYKMPISETFASLSEKARWTGGLGEYIPKSNSIISSINASLRGRGTHRHRPYPSSKSTIQVSQRDADFIDPAHMARFNSPHSTYKYDDPPNRRPADHPSNSVSSQQTFSSIICI